MGVWVHGYMGGVRVRVRVRQGLVVWIHGRMGVTLILTVNLNPLHTNPTNSDRS